VSRNLERQLTLFGLQRMKRSPVDEIAERLDTLKNIDDSTVRTAAKRIADRARRTNALRTAGGTIAPGPLTERQRISFSRPRRVQAGSGAFAKPGRHAVMLSHPFDVSAFTRKAVGASDED
jgi:hypothetical protein